MSRAGPPAAIREFTHIQTDATTLKTIFDVYLPPARPRFVSGHRHTHHMGDTIPDTLRRYADNQCGVVSRRQALDAGMTPGAIKSKLRSSRWRRLRPGVYATFTGPVSRRAHLWAAVLSTDPVNRTTATPQTKTRMRAQLSHETAAEVHKLVDRQSDLIHLMVSGDSHIRAAPGIRIHRTRNLRDLRFPPGELPRTLVEDTILDLANETDDFDEVCALVTRAFGRNLTSAGAMRIVLAERRACRWRAEISELITAADGGAHSVLEFRYDRDVEQAHGLPLSRHQVPFRKKDGGKGFRDRVYEDYNVVVELDGRQGHSQDKQWEDKERDNDAAEDNRQSLRYGWRHVRWNPCGTAVQVANVLRGRGWNGQPRPCSDNCLVKAG